MPHLHTLVHIGDTALIVVGIGLLIARQFRWRGLDPRGVLGLPLIVIAVGLAYVGFGIVTGAHRPVVADAAVLPAELLLVAGTGAVMGRATRFRSAAAGADRSQYRLTRIGLVLWALFIAVRVGSLVLGAHVGAGLPETTGAILVSFGINRLACGLVVRYRVRRRINADDAASGALVAIRS